MEENQVAQQTPESVTEDWEDAPLYPDDAAPDEHPETDTDADFEKLFANPDAETPSGETGTPSDADATPDKSGDKSGETAPADETPEPDYKALYEGMREKENAEKFRAVYNEQLALSGSPAVARMVAMNECGGKAYPLEDASDTPADASGKPDGDFRAALNEIQTLYPDAKEMPQSVMREYMGGKPLKEAYAAYRAGEDAKTIASLRAENAALKKGASNRAAAPVKGTNGDKTVIVDPFLTAFDAEW